MSRLNKTKSALDKFGTSIEYTGKVIGKVFLDSASITCLLCEKLKLLSDDDYHYCDINLKDIDVKISEDGYILCSFCKKVTEKEITKINCIEINELPLYINHENLFVRYATKKRLEG